VPSALYDATGQELHAMVSGIIPGLLMFIGVLAASTGVGAAAGAAIGALAFGIGAAPGAAAGAGLGFEAGIALLDFLGLAFLVGYIGKSMLQADVVAGQATLMAWRSVENRNTQRFVIDQAAHRLAFAVGLVFRGVLQGIVAFLLAKGTAAAADRVPELVSKLRATKLGIGFAEWVERNWRGLVENPKLKGEQESTGGVYGSSSGRSRTESTTASDNTSGNTGVTSRRSVVSKERDLEKPAASKYKQYVSERIRQLTKQGHGPQRHEGQVTNDQLRARAVEGKDPVTGTTEDAYLKQPDGTPETHKYGRHATKVNSEEAYVNADDYLRSSAEFKAEAAGKNVGDRIAVEKSLEEIYGPDYKYNVSGVMRRNEE
jgi:hypothetical protein